MGSFLGPVLVGLVQNEMKVSEAWRGEDKPIWQDFPGGPVVKTPRFHCRRRGFDAWSGKFRLLRGVAPK